MSRMPLGMRLGLVIGAVDVLLMLPLSFPDRRASFAGAFCARFALGFFADSKRKDVGVVDRARLEIALTICDGVLLISITVADPTI